MSGDLFKRASEGQPAEPSARVHNAMLDAILAQKNRQHDQIESPKDQFRQADIVMVRNDTGYDKPRFSVLGINGVIFSADDNLREFQTRIALKGIEPAFPTHLGKFLILLDPLKDGKIGRAWVSGVCPAQIDMVDPDHQFCDIVDGDTTTLRSCAWGTARILYPGSGGSGSGGDWGVVRLCDHPGDSRIARFAGTWAKGATVSVELVDDDFAGTGEMFDVVNKAADVETPDESSYGLLGCRRYGKVWVLDWFECDVAEGS